MLASPHFHPTAASGWSVAPVLSALSVAAMLSLMPAAGAARAAEPQQAGVSAAVRGQVSRSSTLDTSTQAAPETLQAGSSVFLQDRIASGDDSLAQVLLLDESTFKLGPNSDIVIDKFVYDPEQGVGQMLARAAGGTFRYISGAIGEANAENVQIETPVATIGVRGTMFVGDLRRDQDGNLKEGLFALSGPGIDNNANARRGVIQITANGETVTIQRNGWGTYVRPGQPPTPPAPIPADQLAALDQRLSSRPAPAAGAGETAMSNAVAASGATGLSGQDTASTRNRAQSNESTQETETTAADLGAASDLEDFQVGDEAEDAGLLGDMAFLNNPLATWDTLNTISSGTATARQTGVPLYDTTSIDIQSDIDSLADFNASLTSQGTYDVFFSADFSSKRLEAVFDNINSSSRELINGELAQRTDFPETGPGLVVLTADSAGANGITANQACISSNCSGLVFLFQGGDRPVGGILHALSVGDLIGVGLVAADR